MNTISFTDLQLSTNNEVIVCSITDKVSIEIKKYLPIEDKYDLITLALQNSYENGHYNDLKLDMFFHLYIVYMYTNLEFTEAQKDEPAKMFDLLTGNGIMGAILDKMDEGEYNYLLNALKQEVESNVKYKNTMASVINSFIEELPVNAAKAKEIIEQFNPEDYQNVLMMARAANGGRTIE